MDKDFDFKNWKLPLPVIGQLYPGELVVFPSSKRRAVVKEKDLPAKEEPKENKGLHFLGGNGKKVTVIIKAPQFAWLPDDELAFLYKITGSVQMNASDIAIINIGRKPADYQNIKDELHPGKVLMFGVEGADIDLPIEFPEFHVQKFDNIEFLKSPEVKVLMNENRPGKPLKNQLWAALKKMFLNK